MLQELHYRIALTLIPQVGDVVAKELLQHFGSATNIFKAQRHQLEKIPGVGIFRASAIRHFKDFKTVEKEVDFITRNRIEPVFYTDDAYPRRLQHCYDSPVLLYTKGHMNLHAQKMLGVVGTRIPTAYGMAVCEELVEALAQHQVTIVSGMAYGIDIIAHRAALKYGTATIGVLAHGLDRLYPAVHSATALQMQETGGLLTDFASGHKPNRQNFPRRNRIVAGLCDATLVIESGVKGGSLITADMASGYHRDVLAVPGRIGDAASAGCLDLIKQHKAALVSCADDVLDALNWRSVAAEHKPVVQSNIFAEMDDDQLAIAELLRFHQQLHIDEVQYRSGIPQQKLPGVLLGMEMMGWVRTLPGNMYQLTSA